jgi:hypothetical protein
VKAEFEEALREAFSAERFEALLQEHAADSVKIAEYQEQRDRLLDIEGPRLAKVIERLTRRLGQVDDDAVAAVIQAELKAAVQERKAVEARVAELEGYTRG